jgi:transcriptional regulator with XRE-family HTH domain
MRALRLRRAWRQEDLGRRAGLSRDAVHRAETRGLPSLTIGALERLVGALQADLVVEIRWRGAQLDSLVDRLHAAMVTLVARRLERSGWLTWAEVSFNHFGDRGRCDLVAWHPGRKVLMLIEVKTRVGNLHELLGALDVKSRLGSVIADQLGLADRSWWCPAWSSSNTAPTAGSCAVTRRSFDHLASEGGRHSNDSASR